MQNCVSFQKHLLQVHGYLWWPWPSINSNIVQQKTASKKVRSLCHVWCSTCSTASAKPDKSSCYHICTLTSMNSQLTRTLCCRQDTGERVPNVLSMFGLHKRHFRERCGGMVGWRGGRMEGWNRKAKRGYEIDIFPRAVKFFVAKFAAVKLSDEAIDLLERIWLQLSEVDCRDKQPTITDSFLATQLHTWMEWLIRL